MSNDSKNKSNSTSNDNTTTSGSNNNNNNEVRNSRRLYISDIHPGNSDASSDYRYGSEFASNLFLYNTPESHTREVQKSPYKKVWREPDAETLIALDTNTQQKREEIRALILLPLTLNKNKGGDLYDNLNAEVSPDREKMIQMVTGMSSAEYFKSLPERVPNLFPKKPDRYTKLESKPAPENETAQSAEKNTPDEKSVGARHASPSSPDAQPAPIQSKMRVGPPGDRYEQEADAVAEKVVSMDAPTAQRTADTATDAPAQRAPIADSITPLQRSSDPVVGARHAAPLQPTPEIQEKEIKAQGKLQRKDATGDDDDAQAKCAECEKEEAQTAQRAPENTPDEIVGARHAWHQTAQRAPDTAAPEATQLSVPDGLKPSAQHAPAAQASAAAGGEVTPQTESSIRSAKGGGKSMSESERSYFEPRFGADFSGVKIHAGGQANDLAKSINARAFTVGSDIFFGSGEYNSDSTNGKKLMAHELTHTVQQGAVRRKETAQRAPAEPSEKEKEEAATEKNLGQTPGQETAKEKSSSLKLNRPPKGDDKTKSDLMNKPKKGKKQENRKKNSKSKTQKSKPGSQNKPQDKTKNKVQKTAQNKTQGGRPSKKKEKQNSQKSGKVSLQTPVKNQNKSKPGQVPVANQAKKKSANEKTRVQNQPASKPAQIPARSGADQERTLDWQSVIKELTGYRQKMVSGGEKQKAQLRTIGASKKDENSAFIQSQKKSVGAAYDQTIKFIQNTVTIKSKFIEERFLQSKEKITTQASAEIAQLDQIVTDMTSKAQSAGKQKSKESKSLGVNEADRARKESKKNSGDAWELAQKLKAKYQNQKNGDEVVGRINRELPEIQNGFISTGEELAESVRERTDDMSEQFLEDAAEIAEDFSGDTDDIKEEILESRDATIDILRDIADESMERLEDEGDSRVDALQDDKESKVELFESNQSEFDAMIDQGVVLAEENIDAQTGLSVQELGQVMEKIDEGGWHPDFLKKTYAEIIPILEEQEARQTDYVQKTEDNIGAAAEKHQSELTKISEKITSATNEFGQKFEKNSQDMAQESFKKFDEALNKGIESIQVFAPKLQEQMQQSLDKITAKWGSQFNKEKSKIASEINKALKKQDSVIAKFESDVHAQAKEAANRTFLSAVGEFFGGFVEGLGEIFSDMFESIGMILRSPWTWIILGALLFVAALIIAGGGLVLLGAILAVIGKGLLLFGVIMGVGAMLFYLFLMITTPNLSPRERGKLFGKALFEGVTAFMGVEIFKRIRMFKNINQLRKFVQLAGGKMKAARLILHLPDLNKLTSLLTKTKDAGLLLKLLNRVKKTDDLFFLLEKVEDPIKLLGLINKCGTKNLIALLAKTSNVDDLVTLLKNVPRAKTLLSLLSFSPDTRQLIRLTAMVKNTNELLALLTRTGDGKRLLRLLTLTSGDSKLLSALLDRVDDTNVLLRLLRKKRNPKQLLAQLDEGKNANEILQQLEKATDAKKPAPGGKGESGPDKVFDHSSQPEPREITPEPETRPETEAPRDEGASEAQGPAKTETEAPKITEEKLNALLKKPEMTPARLKTLLSHFGDDVNRLENILQNATDNAADLEKLLRQMSPSELEQFANELADLNKFKNLASKYTGNVLQHYGAQFFKEFKGVDSETMRHLLEFDGINKSGSGITGCHDEAMFLRELLDTPPDGVTAPPSGIGRGDFLSPPTPHPADPSIVRYHYSFWAETSQKKLKEPMRLISGDYIKTTIRNLVSEKNIWQKSIQEAVEEAIQSKIFPVERDKFFGISKSGVRWTGWFENGEITTAWIDF